MDAIKGNDLEADTEVFNSDPTIENYLKLRKAHKNYQKRIPRSGGVEVLYAIRPELEKWKLDFEVLSDAIQGCWESIDIISIRLLELMAERTRNNEPHNQRNGLCITDSFIDVIIFFIIEGIYTDAGIPQHNALFFLLKNRLLKSNAEILQTYEKKIKRDAVISIAVSCKRLDMRFSIRECAKALNVNHSSIIRLFEKGEFDEIVKEELSKPPLDMPDVGFLDLT